MQKLWKDQLQQKVNTQIVSSLMGKGSSQKNSEEADKPNPLIGNFFRQTKTEQANILLKAEDKSPFEYDLGVVKEPKRHTSERHESPIPKLNFFYRQSDSEQNINGSTALKSK